MRSWSETEGQRCSVPRRLEHHGVKGSGFML